MKKKFLQLASGILALIFICACWPGAFADAPDIVPASSTASSSAEASAANTVLDETSEDSGSSVGSESFQMSEAPSDTSESMKPVTTPSAASTPETVASEEISADSEANSIVEAPPSDALTLTSSRAALVSKEPLETASPYLPGAADDVLAMESVSIWDMEALPDDLYAAGWASDLYSESGGHTQGHIDLLSAPGKGWNGTQALALVYKNTNMENYWADVISIQLASDTTALTDLSHGTELWFWVDASAFRSSDLMLELKIGGQTPAIGGSYYKIINGEKIADTLPAGYNGADYARIPLGQAYRGWIGVSLDAFGTVSSADVISLYIEPWGDKDSGTLPQSLYLDAFCLVESPYETIWNMENLPEGPLDSSWVSGQGLDAGVVEMRGTAAKGNNGSRALEYHFNTSGGDAYWANGVTIIPSNDASFQSDWSSGDTLWFWLDAHEIDCDILLELTVNSVAPLAGQPFYTLAGGIKTLKTLAPAWEGQTNARIPVAGGYTGWIGLPLSAFAEPISEVRQLQLYTQPWAGDIPAADMPVDKSLYFDDLCLIRSSASAEEEDAHGDLFNQNVAPNDILLYVDTTQRHQEIKAFGVSDAWWAPGIGTRSNVGELLSLLFTDTGIALNNYRHNIGGGVLPDRSDADSYDQAWRAPYSPLAPDGSYDITRNEGGYAVLQSAKALETIDDFTLFINSPPSTMTVSGRTCANPGQTVSNLKKECYDDFASYVTDVVELYLADGVKVKYVSPVNEPQWAWDGGQEGCHYEPDEAFEICRLVIQTMKERAQSNPALKNVKVSMPETAQWGNSAYTNDLYNKMISDPEVAPYIDHFCGHSYGANAATKKGVAAFIQNATVQLPIHQSEWGCSYGYPALGIDTAVELGRVLYEDLTILNAESWSWWIGVSHYNYSDGLIYVNDSNESYDVSKRLWAYGNYSKFIKGFTRVSLDEYSLPDGVYASCYVSPNNDNLTYILVNENASEKTFTFAGLPSDWVAQVYETSARRDCSLRGTMRAGNGYLLPGKSITTFVFDGIDLSLVANGTNPDTPPAPVLPPVNPENGQREEISEVFTFQGLAPMHLETPEDHTVPGLFYVVDPTHNINDWNGPKSNFALNYLYNADIANGSTLDNGEGLKWTVLETTPRTSELCFELANDPSGHSVQDWTEAKALDFYIDLSTYGNETTGLYLRLTEKDSRDGADAQEIWTLNPAGYFWIKDSLNQWTPQAMTGERMDIPAGYKGWIRLMLDERSLNPVGWTSPVSGIFEHTCVTHLWFGLENKGAAGDTAWIDAFSVVRDVADDTESESSPDPSISSSTSDTSFGTGSTSSLTSASNSDISSLAGGADAQATPSSTQTGDLFPLYPLLLCVMFSVAALAVLLFYKRHHSS